jgi:prepilin-type N-terminal cleavage/methylation domain-containing protein
MRHGLRNAMKRNLGFTLIEIAVALTIIALLSVGAMTALQLAMLRTRVAETQDALREAREAVVTFAVVNRSLPCPALSATDGNEQSRAGGRCTQIRGLLPWQTLGIRGLDGWGNRLGYVASPPLVNGGGAPIQLNDAGAVTIMTRDAAGAAVPVNSSGAVAFAVWSHGANGRGATTVAGSVIADDSASNVDEDANTSRPGTSNDVFARDGSISAGSHGGEYDDLVEWESRYVLFGRMMSAGQLP